MPFRHIAVAYDGSKQAQSALVHAADLVSSNPGAELTIVHVYQMANFVVGEAILTAPVHMELKELAEAERLLEEAKSLVPGLPRVHTVLLQGDPGRVLLEYAAEHDVDLIVIGSRGLGALKELFLGSVSHYVVQHATIPVLVIKSSKA